MSKPLLAALRSASLTDHSEILARSEAILVKSPTDSAAQQIKLVALLKLDRFADAATFAKSPSYTLASPNGDLEKAYAFFKTGRLDDARSIAARLVTEGDADATTLRGARHVEAQAAYRAEKWNSAAQTYEELGRETSGAEAEINDLRINLLAVRAQAAWSGNDGNISHQTSSDDFKGFETAFNWACGELARGDLKKAGQLLGRAEYLCQESQELSEEEREGEVLPILVQQLYLAALLAEKERAKSIIKEINANSAFAAVDALTQAIVAVNSALTPAAAGDPFMMQKLLDPLLGGYRQLAKSGEIVSASNNPSEKPFDFQHRILTHDAFALPILCHQSTSLRQSITTALQDRESTGPSTQQAQLAVLLASSCIQDLPLHEALQKLKRLPSAKAAQEEALLLLRSQLECDAGNPLRALTALESYLKIKEAYEHPAIVSLTLHLYHLLGRQHAAATLLFDATKPFIRSDTPVSPAEHKALLHHAARVLASSLQRAHREHAARLYAILHEHTPGGRAAILGDIATSLNPADHFSISAAKLDELTQLSASYLTPLNEITKSIDVAALSAAGVPPTPPPAAPLISVSRDPKHSTSSAGEGQPLKKKRRHISTKLPKKHVEGEIVDPERWLPMRDRSYYKAPKKRGKKAGGAQGRVEVVQSAVMTEKAGGSAGDGGGGKGGGGGKKKKGKK